jgi:hypothetical protein
MKRFTTNVLVTLASVALFCGCGTTNPKAPKNISDGAWHKDKDIQRVWLAPGFDFNGYNGIYIGQSKYAAVERPNEVEMRAWAVKYLRTALAGAIPHSGVIQSTYVTTNEIPATAKVLKLENTIVEYEKGGGGARYFAGLMGAGQPVIKVRGTITYNDQKVFEYEARRSGESAGARMAGGLWSLSYSDRAIQTEDINDLAQDFADFIRRTANHVEK